jgi:hypothetical protein
MIVDRTKPSDEQDVVLDDYEGTSKPDWLRAQEARVAQADAFAASVQPMIRPLRACGMSLRAVAQILTERGVETPRGGAWTADAVRRAMMRTVI